MCWMGAMRSFFWTIPFLVSNTANGPWAWAWAWDFRIGRSPTSSVLVVPTSTNGSPSLRLRTRPFLLLRNEEPSKSSTSSRRSITHAIPPPHRTGAYDGGNDNGQGQGHGRGREYRDDWLYMGISRELDELPRGQRVVKELSVGGSGSDHRHVTVRKLSQRPPIFLMEQVLSEDECRHIQESVERRGMWEEAQTLDQAQSQSPSQSQSQPPTTTTTTTTTTRKNCRVAWLPNHAHTLWSDLAVSVRSIFLPFYTKTKHTNANANANGSFQGVEGVEEFQVVHYDTRGEFRLHHDGERRLLTVIYYLNGVSETWFPLADHGRRMSTREEALAEVGEHEREREHETIPTKKTGLLLTAASTSDNDTDTGTGTGTDNENGNAIHRVPVRRGDAVAFYNYFQDASMEWNAMHAGLPAESSKWIATHWYHHVPRPRPRPQQPQPPP